MPYGREILLRNVKYALRRMDLFHFTENKAFYFTISQEIISHRTKRDISLIKKPEVVKTTAPLLDEAATSASRSGENNAETAAAISNIVDTPTDIIFI